jgi:hypothetical protein
MNCEEFQSHFSDVLDNGPQAAAAVGLTEHLAVCSACREEFDALMECRRLIATLPVVEPPSGLVTRIMAHVHDSANQPRTWKRLLLPLRVKIPLHATAVVLIAVMSVYLFQKEDRQNAPLSTGATDLPSGAQPAAPADPSNASAASDQRSEEKAIESAPRARRSSPPVRRNHPATRETARERPPEAAKEAKRSVPIPAQGVSASMRPYGLGTFREPGFRTFPREREFTNLGEPVADYELFVRRRPDPSARESDADAGGAETETSSRTAEPTSRPGTPSDTVIDVLWYTIPQDRYDQFKKDLSAQATIESEVVLGAKDKHSSFRFDAPFYVKVIVLSPTPR